MCSSSEFTIGAKEGRYLLNLGTQPTQSHGTDTGIRQEHSPCSCESSVTQRIFLSMFGDRLMPAGIVMVTFVSRAMGSLPLLFSFH
jgi:hypothetical protein